MHDPKKFEMYAISIKGYQESWQKAMIKTLVVMPLVFYILIGATSIFQITEGADIIYMPFWHAPWKWLFNLIFTIFA